MSNNAAAQFTPPSLLLTTIGLSLATFMQVLDTTIANVFFYRITILRAGLCGHFLQTAQFTIRHQL